jgi:hypothetical protein
VSEKRQLDQEARRRRLALIRRFEQTLEKRRAAWWSPERRATPEERVRLDVTLEDLAELTGALEDARIAFGLREDLHQHESYLRRLGDELQGARNLRAVLRRFGLVEPDRKRRTLSDGIELAQFYCNLIDGRTPVYPPRWWKARDSISPSPRPFGEMRTADDLSALGTSYYRAPVSDLEAVRIVRQELGCPSDNAARSRLLAARRAVQAAHRAAYKARSSTTQLPPIDFPIPSTKTLQGGRKRKV